MGDRCYAMFELGGHIETVEEIEALVQAICDQGVRELASGKPMGNTADVKKLLRHCVQTKEPLMFDDAEVNYGRFGEIEAVCDEIAGLGVYVRNDAGGGYPAGHKTIMPDGTEYECVGEEDPAISLHQLQQARKADDPLAEIDKLIAEAVAATGRTLPPFTVSPAVAAWLKIFGDKAA